MKKNLCKVGTFFAVAVLVGFAIPANATTISFSNVVSGSGDITAVAFGANEPLLNSASCSPAAAICNVNFQTLMISGAPTGAANGTYTGLFLHENFDATTNTLTIAGSLGCASCGTLPGIPSSVTLLTIVFAADLTGNAGASTFTLDSPPPPSISSITVNSILAGDLGDTGPYHLSSMTLTGQVGGAIPNYTSLTGTLVLTDAVPEPAPVLLTGMGLGLIALASRRRFSKAK